MSLNNYNFYTMGSSSYSATQDKFDEYKDFSCSFHKKRELLSELKCLWEECTNKATDHFDKPMSFKTFNTASKLVSRLPINLLPSEITPDRDGFVGLEWNNSDGRSLTVLVENEVYIFAALLNSGERLRGTAVSSESSTVPESILVAIGKVFE